jgi:hypothetical protein
VNVSGSIAKNTAAISFQVNGRSFITAEVADGKALAEIPVALFAEDAGSLSTIVYRAVDLNGAYIQNPRGTVTGVYSNAHSGFLIIDESGADTADYADNSGEGSDGSGSKDTVKNDGTGHDGNTSSDITDTPEKGRDNAAITGKVLMIACPALLIIAFVTVLILKKRKS